MEQWLDVNTFLGLAANEWWRAIAATVVSYIFIVSLAKFLIARLEILAARTVTRLDDMLVEVLKHTHRFVIAFAALLIGSEFLSMTGKWEIRISHLWFIVIAVQIALWINRGLSIWTTERLQGQSATSHSPIITTMMAWIFRALLWSVLILAMLSNVGVNITAFVASLGVGGVAVALALQSILSDLFASAAIGLDKPFEIGDFIVFGDIAGNIEHIGLKTTRIRSLSGEQIVCSNTELLKNTIHNYKRMSERRILFGFGITYEASPEQVRQVPAIVKNAIESAGTTRFDRAHMKGFGESALQFEAVYYVTNPDYNLYMDIQQSINLELMTELAANGIHFARPTRTLHIVSSGEVSDKLSEEN
ncbi:mechanosensitive ion channel family protein [Herbaspirillum sp. RTI4]|uniref:mechanosensitive ion channel family protein n=1 Tax=Herbaspirillum sp. RTI4 TaxID=3048640 RepID=UPI002AB59111|nr:mechanosensitive ion channel family protein [Herbaspirillum sp. RTI4]MDY7579737.1 mechanosensitive ion channel family protein [Herbaspirillum sp. RTI4]MEA9982711.1 mechanosensitive ion channel family protein [Herbaspirillum sp. RTI4]